MMARRVSPEWERDGANWPHREFSQFVETADCRWHVQRMTKASSPQGTVLLIHGTGAATHSWAGLAPLLARDFDVVAFDLPGHGFTSRLKGASPSLPALSGAVARLCGELSISPTHLVGHSAGAAIMVRMIASGAVSPGYAVSINGALASFDGAAGFALPLLAKFLHFNPFTPFLFAQGASSRRAVERLVNGTGSQPPQSYIDCYATLMQRPSHAAGALAMMANWDLSHVETDLANIVAPTLFIAGERDRAVPPDVARRAAAQTPHGSVVVLPGLGHLAHEEDPQTVWAKINQAFCAGERSAAP